MPRPGSNLTQFLRHPFLYEHLCLLYLIYACTILNSTSWRQLKSPFIIFCFNSRFSGAVLWNPGFGFESYISVGMYQSTVEFTKLIKAVRSCILYSRYVDEGDCVWREHTGTRTKRRMTKGRNTKRRITKRRNTKRRITKRRKWQQVENDKRSKMTKLIEWSGYHCCPRMVLFP